ncbi:hypothetical protein BS47DRAFT_1336370 [Hydnum rufescens UP504]|uniref:Uncharacterized protein n=1 Tax=Hydnum rufescens UP504 TaxID=1448309 RepID=A0A9P6BC98_9AGAM|nr:hypothetical protein BS47DRAFT_1336370 [Hydnum rufescens UP504]
MAEFSVIWTLDMLKTGQIHVKQGSELTGPKKNPKNCIYAPKPSTCPPRSPPVLPKPVT